MKLSDTCPYLGSFFAGAIATSLAMRSELHGRAIKVLGAGGLAGAVIATLSFTSLLYVIHPLLTKAGYDMKKDSKKNFVRAVVVLTVSTVLPASVGIIAWVALANRIGIPVSYKTAAFVTTSSTVGFIGGAIFFED